MTLALTKTPKGVVSKGQAIWHSWAIREGFRVVVARGLSDVEGWA